MPDILSRARAAAMGILVLGLGACDEDFGPAPANNPPEPEIEASQTLGNAPLAVSFDAARSVDVDGYLTGFTWDFGDGTTVSGLTASHTFTAPAPGSGSFGPGADIGAETLDSTSGVLDDVDGDGDDDLVVGGMEENRLYLNDGTGGFAPGVDIGTETDNTMAVALGDVDGDGDEDLVVGNAAAANRLYLNDGSGGFSFCDPSGPNDCLPAEVDDTFAVALVDVDGDSDLDIIAGNYLPDRNRLYRNDGTGNFGTSGSDITTEGLNTTSLATGDVDGDGDADLVTGNAALWRNDIDADGQIDPEAENRLYLNDGTGNFTGGDIAPGDQHDTMAVALEDLDGDDIVDVLVAGNAGAANRLYLNDGSGAFGAGADLGGEIRNTRALAFGDLDNDGDRDLVVGNHFRQANQVFLGDGAGGFTGGGEVTRDAHNTRAVLPGDVDGDGDADVIALNDGIGTTGAGDVNRLYRNGNGYTVQLTVTDDSGASATASRFIVVGAP